jgi:hypothetical protein
MRRLDGGAASRSPTIPHEHEPTTPAAFKDVIMEIPPQVATTLTKLMDDYRIRCLWFLRSDYYPATVDEAVHVLQSIQRHGDAAGFKRAAEVLEWLSPTFSAKSAGS